jgi:FixJ family two-component response regulator
MTTQRSPGSGTVYAIDDDQSFLRSVTRLLGAVGYTVYAFESAQEFLEQLTPDLAGCVLADLQMPGLNGLQLQESLRKSDNPLPVVFLTGQGDISTTVNAMKGGAEDFLTKRAAKEELLAAVERALDRDAQEREQRSRLRTVRGKFEDLSAREMEVLEWVVRGKMNKEIADALQINLRTVKLHRTNITRKLQVQSVAELTRLADEAGLFGRGKAQPAGES